MTERVFSTGSDGIQLLGFAGSTVGVGDMAPKRDELTLTMAFVVYAYAAVALGLPFIADADPPALVFFGAWLGGSVAAGFFVPRRWMFALPIGAFVVLMFVLTEGYTDSEFLSDALSSVALLVLAAGQLGGLAVGYGAAHRAR